MYVACVCGNKGSKRSRLEAHIGGSAPNGVLCVCVAHTSAELLPLGAAADSPSAQFAFSRTIICNNKQNKKCSQKPVFCLPATGQGNGDMDELFVGELWRNA